MFEDQFVEDTLRDARVTLEQLKTTVTDIGLPFFELPLLPLPVGVGIGIAWTDTDFVLVSIEGAGNHYFANLTSGVLRDVVQDRSLVLDACNRYTRDHAQMPVFLVDAETGWDLVLQQRFPANLLTYQGIAPLFKQYLEAHPIMAKELRKEFEAAGLGGRRYSLDEDGQRLLLQSLT